jgi:hypothetical protein
MTPCPWASCRVLWGSEIYLTKKNFEALIKYFYGGEDPDDADFSEDDDFEADEDVTYNFWHGDDDKLCRAHEPLKLTTLSCLALLRNGGSEKEIRTTLEDNPDNTAALAAWDGFVDSVRSFEIDDATPENTDGSGSGSMSCSSASAVAIAGAGFDAVDDEPPAKKQKDRDPLYQTRRRISQIFYGDLEGVSSNAADKSTASSILRFVKRQAYQLLMGECDDADDADDDDDDEDAKQNDDAGEKDFAVTYTRDNCYYIEFKQRGSLLEVGVNVNDYEMKCGFKGTITTNGRKTTKLDPRTTARGGWVMDPWLCSRCGCSSASCRCWRTWASPQTSRSG